MLATLDNVPRKPKQFRNFTANSLNLRGRQATDIVDAMWNHLSMLRDKEQETKKKEEDEQKRIQEEREREEERKRSGTEKTSKAQGSSENDEKKSMDRNGAKDSNISSKKVKKAMKKVLKKAPGRSMKLKALRKAVQTYLECGDSGRLKMKKLIRQELAESNKIKVEGKLVILQG